MTTEDFEIHVEQSIVRALDGRSYLDPEVLKINGFSTPTMRHLFSNLCHVEGLNYLEVGLFCGATFFAALNNNPVFAQGIENFSQLFDQADAATQLEDNFNRWWKTGDRCQIAFCDAFEKDWRPDIVEIRYDIYFYDGEHTFDFQRLALPTLFPMLADRFLFIVDDTNWETVATGTKSGFAALEPRVKIEREWHLVGETPSDDPIWHNGLDIYLCSKV